MNGSLDHATTSHLSALALDALALDEPVSAEVRDHLARCALCQGRLADVQAFDAGLDLAPPLAPAPTDERADPAPMVADGAQVLSFDDARRRRSQRGVWAGGLLAVAAAALLMLRPGPAQQASAGGPGAEPDEVLRVRGGDRALAGFDVGFVLHDGVAVRTVGDGDEVHAGERLGFRLAMPAVGHVAILGIDESGEPYRCHPQGDGDEMAEHHPSDLGTPGASRAEPADASTAFEVAVDETVAFDEALGTERIVAVACPTSRSMAALLGALRDGARASAAASELPPLAEGCVQRQIRLHKRAKAPAAESP